MKSVIPFLAILSVLFLAVSCEQESCGFGRCTQAPEILRLIHNMKRAEALRKFEAHREEAAKKNRVQRQYQNKFTSGEDDDFEAFRTEKFARGGEEQLRFAREQLKFARAADDQQYKFARREAEEPLSFAQKATDDDSYLN